MKVIDLLNKISNQEPVPNKILVDGKYFYWDSQEMFYQTEHKLDLLEVGEDYSTWDFLNFIVMEDEEEIDIDRAIIIEKDSSNQEFIRYKNNGATGSGYSCDYSTIDLIFAKALKQLNKKIKEKE